MLLCVVTPYQKIFRNIQDKNITSKRPDQLFIFAHKKNMADAGQP